MKPVKSQWIAAVIGLAILAVSTTGHAQDKDKAKDKQGKGKGGRQQTTQPTKSSQPGRTNAPPGAGKTPPDTSKTPADTSKTLPDTHKTPPDTSKTLQKLMQQREQESSKTLSDTHKTPPDTSKTLPDTHKTPPVTLTEEKKANGKIERKAPSGAVRERVENRPDGEHTEHFAPGGRKDREEIQKSDGTKQRTQYDLGGREKQAEVIHKDGSAEITNVHYGRDGNPRVRETVQRDSSGTVVSKTVSVHNTVIFKGGPIEKNTWVERNYVRGHYGFVYRPVYVVHPRVFVSWYDPYWYSTAGVVIVHPFHYAWGWEDYGWYHYYHGPYWVTYDVYPAPSYWVTDWMVAGYLADHYNAQVSADQAREEARLAREEAAKASQVAQDAKEEAEIAEAKAAQAQAELRAKNAEDRAARIERTDARMKELAGKPNPKAKPIDKDTKEVLKKQIEQTIAEKKQFAEQSEKGGNPPLPDVSKALAEPKHVYPVSKAISVTSAKDSSPAGTLSEGDLLKLDPGQEETLKNADENTLVTMRVMTSKGEEGEVPAGTSVNVAIRDLQEFDNEFRAKLDVGLAEAEKNKDSFKQGAVAQ